MTNPILLPLALAHLCVQVTPQETEILAAQILQINFLDHVIVGQGYFRSTTF
jgi:hypothetical protein